MTERFHTIDGEMFMNQPLSPISFVVGGLLPNGLHTDPFNRISGTTGLSGAVDSSFTLVEEKRGSGKATLSCIGRDIEYREMELKRNENNIWELLSGS